MTDKVEIYGQDVKLTDLAGNTVVDVMVLVRTVAFDEHGNAQEGVLVTATPQTGVVARTGILSIAQDIVAGSYGYELADEDEEDE